MAHTLHSISEPKTKHYQLSLYDMSTSKLFSSFFLCFMFVLFVLDPANAQGLKVGFYAKTCPEAEFIVKKVITQTMSVAPSLAGPLLRMHFHDCFVRVCN